MSLGLGVRCRKEYDKSAVTGAVFVRPKQKKTGTLFRMLTGKS